VPCAPLQRAKNTETARMKVSQNQKLFFQNPENRRMRGLQMKGGSKLHGGYVATTSFLGMSCSCKVVLDDGVLWMND
jgi:hypothetical protein